MRAEVCVLGLHSFHSVKAFLASTEIVPQLSSLRVFEYRAPDPRRALSCSPALVFHLTVRCIWWSLLFVVQLWAVGSCIKVCLLFRHHLSTRCLHILGLEASLFFRELGTPSCQIHICAPNAYQSSGSITWQQPQSFQMQNFLSFLMLLSVFPGLRDTVQSFTQLGGPDLRCLEVKVLQGFGANPANMIFSVYLWVAEVMLNSLLTLSTRILQEHGRQVPSVIPFSMIFSNQSKAN